MSGDTPAADPKNPGPAVLAALAKLARPSSAEDVAAATGLSENTVRRTLGQLVARGEAKRAGGGRFTTARTR